MAMAALQERGRSKLKGNGLQGKSVWCERGADACRVHAVVSVGARAALLDKSQLL